MRALRAGAVAAASAIGLALLSGAPATSALDTDLSSAAGAELPRGCFQPEHDPDASVPPPFVCDRAGTDQDEVFVPADLDERFDYYDGQWSDLNEGVNSNRGKTPFVIRTQYLSGQGSYVDGPVYRLVFDDAGVSGVDAKNSYGARVHQETCEPGGDGNDYTSVSFSYTNVADGRLRYAPVIYLAAERISDSRGPGIALQEEKILDGETRPMGTLFLANGWNRVEVTTKRELLPAPDVWIPRCGGRLQPPAATPPRGDLNQIRGGYKMEANLDNLGGMRRTSFRLTVKPRQGKRDSTEWSVESHNHREVTYGKPAKAKRGTSYVLQAQVVKGDRMVWKTVAKKTAR